MMSQLAWDFFRALKELRNAEKFIQKTDMKRVNDGVIYKTDMH